jgi:hypothetical protein
MKKSVFIALSIIAVAIVAVGCNLRFGEPSAPADETSTAGVVPQDYVNYKWVSYTPTGYEPGVGKAISQTSITGDLYLLAQSGFTGLVTTTAGDGFDMIPQLARANGFQAVIMGIYDPNNDGEINQALAAAPFVDAYALGHCGLGTDYTVEDLQAAVTKLNVTGRSVTIWETPQNYIQVIYLTTFNSPVVYAYEDGKTSPLSAVNYSLEQFVNVASLDPAKTTMLFGVGYPTEGGDFTNEEMQMLFYQNIPVDFPWCYQEAFDQPWREGATMPHYGLFDQYRNPKMYMAGDPFAQ